MKLKIRFESSSFLAFSQYMRAKLIECRMCCPCLLIGHKAKSDRQREKNQKIKSNRKHRKLTTKFSLDLHLDGFGHELVRRKHTHNTQFTEIPINVSIRNSISVLTEFASISNN